MRLPHGYLSHRLLFEGHPKSGFNFAVDWNLSVDSSGAVLHNISILPRFSTERTHPACSCFSVLSVLIDCRPVTAADRKNEVLSEVPEQFRMMVAQRGVQAAVDVTAALARLEQ